MALDSLRERGVALIMEGHAAKGNSQNVHRDLAPRGSAALMGWPEFGFGIHPDPSNEDREAGRQWPKELHRGGRFPWTGDTVAPNVRRIVNGAERVSF